MSGIGVLTICIGASFLTLTLMTSTNPKLDRETIEWKLLMLSVSLSMTYVFLASSLVLGSGHNCLLGFVTANFIFAISRGVNNIIMATKLRLFGDYKAVVIVANVLAFGTAFAAAAANIADLATSDDICVTSPREPWWTVTVVLQPMLGSAILGRAVLLGMGIMPSPRCTEKHDYIASIKAALRRSMKTMAFALIAMTSCALIVALVKDSGTVLMSMVWDVTATPLSFFLGMPLADEWHRAQQGPLDEKIQARVELTVDASGELSGDEQLKDESEAEAEA